jgi:hypothetical protein
MPSQNIANKYLLAVELAIRQPHQLTLAMPSLKRIGILERPIAIHGSSMDLSFGPLVPAYVFLYTA